MKKLVLAIAAIMLLVGCGTDTSAKKVKTDKTQSQTAQVDTDNDNDEASDAVQSESQDNTSAGGNTVDADTNENVAVPGNKEIYTKKLDDLEASLADLEETANNSTQTEMNIAESDIAKKWDGALNEIYGVLQDNLTSDEMSQLKAEEKEWINQRDETAKKESSKYEGGSLEPFEYASVVAKLTKERCYELVENYMD